MIKFTEASFLGALAAEVAADLENAERKSEITLVLDNVASKWDSMVITERLSGVISGFFSLNHAVNLLLCIATSFGKKNFVAVNSWGFNILKAVQTISPLNFGFIIIKNSLLGRQKFQHARNWGGIEFFHELIIAYLDFYRKVCYN